ncbi:hypothetical protein SAMN06265222_101635 [Neorhodopirellula lusitana]|uniref:DUF1508 domain-containing protein n=1 Tax=Neorhodopirellula lusitana TaxID=445327 RepID=A0ABY1PSA7_9BACT|nr:hypothetical protein [Neorhodopirellula lusitana]SMP41701.1 hypothetical protein SAMN06265222_101635 [Neorhodopirellula lusitana]
MPKSKADRIEKWLPRGWKESTSGSEAKWKNISGYHIAVMEDHDHPAKWKYRIGRQNSKVLDYSQSRYSTEDDAKRAVLEILCNKLEIA